MRRGRSNPSFPSALGDLSSAVGDLSDVKLVAGDAVPFAQPFAVPFAVNRSKRCQRLTSCTTICIVICSAPHRDIFGHQITEETWVFTNVWFEGDEYGEQRSVQEVDYPHGLREQHCASLHMREDIYDCELQSVITVRAGLHFVHLWKRNARKKMRRRMRYEVLLLCWRRTLPREVRQNIFEHILNPNRG